MATRPNQTPPVVRAGIYTRISWDPDGQRAGVERQRLDCEALCGDRGWEIAQYFEDNDRSAYSGKRRPAYECLLAAVEERRLDAVVTWHNDRLHRSPRELESFIDLVERSGVRVAVVTGGDYDLTTPEGRFTARIVGAVARKESEDRSRRVRRKHRPGRALEPRAAHPREHPDEVPAHGCHFLRRVWRSNVLPPSGRPHEALRVRRPSPRPPADDRGPTRRRSRCPARPRAAHDAGLSGGGSRSIRTRRRRIARPSARGAGISAEPHADPRRRFLRARCHWPAPVPLDQDEVGAGSGPSPGPRLARDGQEGTP